MSSDIIERIFRTYQKLSKDGKFVNPAAFYQKHELYQEAYEEASTYFDLPAVELPTAISEQLTPEKRKGGFERPVTSPVKSPKRNRSPENVFSNPPEPYIDPDLKLPIKMCYPAAGYCVNTPVKKHKSIERPSSPKPNLSPRISLPQYKTSMEKIPSPVIKSPRKTPPSSGEKRDKNIIKVIKNIETAKLIPKKMGTQSGYNSFELKKIVIDLGLHPKSNKVQMIDQIKDVIAQYT
jgi:hypothetical protein